MVRLTQEEIKFYHENGYLILKNALSEVELERVSEEYDKLFARQYRNGDAPQIVQGILNLQYHHAVFSKLLFNESILDAVADVLATENIVLHHTFGCHYNTISNYPMHQDYHYFPHEKDSLVGALLHLDAADPKTGGTLVYPGSHRLGPLEDIGAMNGNFHYVDQAQFPFEKATPVPADRGDIVLFSYLLVHGSTQNISRSPRRLLLMQFAAADDRPIGNQQLRPSQGLVLRGANPDMKADINRRFDSN